MGRTRPFSVLPPTASSLLCGPGNKDGCRCWLFSVNPTDNIPLPLGYVYLRLSGERVRGEARKRGREGMPVVFGVREQKRSTPWRGKARWQGRLGKKKGGMRERVGEAKK